MTNISFLAASKNGLWPPVAGAAAVFGSSKMDQSLASQVFVDSLYGVVIEHGGQKCGRARSADPQEQVRKENTGSISSVV